MNRSMTLVQQVMLVSFVVCAASVKYAMAQDCNSNGVPDLQDIDPTDPDGDGEVSADCNANAEPDECELPMLLATLIGSDTVSGDEFGYRLSLDGDTAVVGVRIAGDSGAAYVFRNIAGTWSQMGKLMASDAQPNDYFGTSVAIDGDVIVVGSPYVDDGTQNGGAAYVFRDIAGVWQQVDRLIADDGADLDNFGWSVAIAADHILVGAPGDDDAGASAGSAYLFREVAGDWVQSAKLHASDAMTSDLFGHAVRIDGDTAAILSPNHLDDATGARNRAVYVFREIGGNWLQIAALGPAGRDSTIDGIDLDGDTIAVGEPFDTPGGRVLVYREVGGIWQEHAILTAADAQNEDYFGASVSIDGDTIIVGHYSDGVEEFGSGAAYVFKETAGAWRQTMKFASFGSSVPIYLGGDVAVSGSVAVIGQPFAGGMGGTAFVVSLDSSGTDCIGDGTLDECRPDCNGNGLGDICDINAGLSADCNRNDVPDECELALGEVDDCDADAVPDECTLARGLPLTTRRIIASNGQSNELFGGAVAVDGDTMVVGATSSSSAVGESVYVYRNVNGVWQLDEQLRAELLVGRNSFGHSVGISGDTIVIGAFGDDDNGPNRGAVYVFRSINGAWERIAKLYASDGVTSAHLGRAVAIEGDTIFAGAPITSGGASGSGAVYIFQEINGAWQEVDKLLAPNSSGLGIALSVDGGTVVTGASYSPSTAGLRGVAYVFRQINGAWQQIATMFPPPGFIIGRSSVAIEGSTVVIGLPEHDFLGENSGVVHVYRETGTEWLLDAELGAIDLSLQFRFGTSVAINEGKILVGAVGAAPDLNNHFGSAYLFHEVAGYWRQVSKLSAEDAAPNPDFGTTVALGASTAFVGASRDTVNGVQTGSIYLFDVSALTGDCNGNFLLDTCEALESLNDFAAALVQGSDQALDFCLYDADRNGALDARDIAPFIDRLLAP